MEKPREKRGGGEIRISSRRPRLLWSSAEV